MRTGGLRSLAMTVVAILMLVISDVGTAQAVPIQSPNFEVSEPEFGAGSALETCSGEYCAHASIGNPAAGNTSGSGKNATFSEVEPDSDPTLEVIIEPGISELGVLDTTKAATKTTIVKVRNYMNDGYQIQIMGKPPVYNNHRLKTFNKPTKYEAGEEIFGINLTTNTDPNVGESLKFTSTEIPGAGEIMSGYDEPNHFMYRDGDVLARSEGESSEVIYTISMVVGIANSTPAGHYKGDYNVVVFPIF